MKVVIIGGGIAGMALAVLLRKNGINVSLNERDRALPTMGHAFLLHPDAMDVIKDIASLMPELEMPGQIIDRIILKRPDNTVIQTSDLDSWICTKRVSIIKYISSFLTNNEIQFNRLFSHFIYENEKAIAAVFANGEIEYGDIFIGSDGANSLVRKTLFGEVAFSPVEVKEIVGVVRKPELISKLPNTFKKYISKEKGLAVGLIPCSTEEMVWFMQFDIRLQTDKFDTPDKIKDFCISMLSEFPSDVQEILEKNDFNNVYIWRSTDFDLLPSFHKGNVALIGDAAHVALPFTSAGTTNALLDAAKMAELIIEENDHNEIFHQFYEARSSFVKEHIGLGREIKYNFLNAVQKEVKLPLITNLKDNDPNNFPPKIEIIYFTDPVCSTCWLVQPQLRKLALLYGDCFEMKYHMGGLLPSWVNYERDNIKEPKDAAKYWKELSTTQSMPISPDVWMNSPLSSSFPPSIAIKAAQLQNKIKAYHYHRRIKELLFVESKNVTDLDVLIYAAEEQGLDTRQLLEDISKFADTKFQEDLDLATKLNVTVLPTFILKNANGDEIRLEGYQEFETMEKIILDLCPFVQMDTRKRSPLELFNLFHSMTIHEVSYLLETSIIETDKILKTLSHSGLILERINKTGTIWILNQGVFIK